MLFVDSTLFALSRGQTDRQTDKGEDSILDECDKNKLCGRPPQYAPAPAI